MQSLGKARERKALSITAIEGEKEIEMARAAKIEFQSVFFLKEIASKTLLRKLEILSEAIEFYDLSKDLFEKISYRETTGGIIALVKTRTKSLSDIVLPENPLVIIIEGIEKPGNLGAILRTADAVNADAVVCCHLPTDIFNPNVIRSSLGTVFTVPLALADNMETMAWLRRNKIKTYCTNLHKATDYHLQDFTSPSAIVMGTESSGVSKVWIDFADTNIKIPMLGKIDSMNVSVAAAILVYEARRQRLLCKTNKNP